MDRLADSSLGGLKGHRDASAVGIVSRKHNTNKASYMNKRTHTTGEQEGLNHSPQPRMSGETHRGGAGSAGLGVSGVPSEDIIVSSTANAAMAPMANHNTGRAMM